MGLVEGARFKVYGAPVSQLGTRGRIPVAIGLNRGNCCKKDRATRADNEKSTGTEGQSSTTS